MNEETRALEELMRDFKEHNTKYAKNYEDVCYSAIQSLQQQLKDKDEKISKVKDYCKEALKELLVGFKIIPTGNVLINIEKILESNKED